MEAVGYTEKESIELIHANFFFIDVVKLSSPITSTKMQIKKIKLLNKIISECDAFKLTPKENLIVLPTGDGVCIGFLKSPDLPLKLALQFKEKLNEHNKGKIPADVMHARIGINSGGCFIFDGLLGQKNVWGPGIILAKRIMDLGDDDHILVGPQLAEELHELSDEYRTIIKPIHDYTIKHDVPLLIYSAYGKNFGNSTPPKKNSFQQSRLQSEITRLQNTTMYNEIKVELTLKDSKNMLVNHKRTYEIENNSDKPIEYVLHGIGTDVAKPSINDLALKIYDGAGKKMKISSINLDNPYSKEFSTVFENPITKGQKGRSYSIEYEIEEPKRFFEDSFMINCKKFILSFTGSPDANIKQPTLYNVNLENDTKILSKTKPTIENLPDNKLQVTWEETQVVKGQTYRIEW